MTRDSIQTQQGVCTLTITITGKSKQEQQHMKCKEAGTKSHMNWRTKSNPFSSLYSSRKIKETKQYKKKAEETRTVVKKHKQKVSGTKLHEN